MAANDRVMERSTEAGGEASSLERMIGLLDLFEEPAQSWTFDRIHARLGYSRSTLYRYLKVLTDAEILSSLPGLGFTLGPRIAELRVRHHARRFGASKYGLSRVYKVLLDLMTIQTITAFASRPLLWFSMLSLPLLCVGAALIGWDLVTLGSGPSSQPCNAQR